MLNKRKQKSSEIKPKVLSFRKNIFYFLKVQSSTFNHYSKTCSLQSIVCEAVHNNREKLNPSLPLSKLAQPLSLPPVLANTP